MSKNVINLDSYKEVHDIIKSRLNLKSIIIAGVINNQDGDILTYISPDMLDINVVYILQTLKDLRDSEINDISNT